MKLKISRQIKSLVSSLIMPLACASSVGLMAHTARASVWETQYQWDANWEERYHEWVDREWDKDFFTRPGFWQDVKMDCADTVYSMRLIFAALHGLPFAINDSTGGGGVISNEMSRFDKYKPEERKRKFLFYVYKTISTSSLPRDTYPVAVSRDAIGSGRMILTDALSHHSWTVKYLSDTGIPFLLFASRPARTILFERFEFPSMKFTFQDGLNPERHAGFRAFRQPQDLKKPVWDVPGYSLEQYQIPYEKWIKTMQKRLQLKEESPAMAIRRLLDSACLGAKERVDSVNEALDALDKVGGRCFTAEEFDDYSTPSRDTRLKASFDELMATYESALNKGINIGDELSRIMASVASGSADAQALSYCPIEIEQGQVLSLGQVRARSQGGQLSSNPHDPLEMRWGSAPFPSERAKNCPVY